jgi:hypothetical protein
MLSSYSRGLSFAALEAGEVHEKQSSRTRSRNTGLPSSPSTSGFPINLIFHICNAHYIVNHLILLHLFIPIILDKGTIYKVLARLEVLTAVLLTFKSSGILRCLWG